MQQHTPAGLTRRIIAVVIGLAGAGAAAALLVTGGRPDAPRPAPASAPAALHALASAAAGQDDPGYRVARELGGLSARNARHGLVAWFDRNGVAVSASGSTLRLELAGVGRAAAVQPVAAVAPVADRNRISFTRPGVTEWYVNGPLGLEQGFTLDRRPAGTAGRVRVLLQAGGPLAAQARRSGDGVLFGGLAYRGVAAWDASGRELPARLALRGSAIELSVDDAGARYPLTIDPFIQLGSLAASDAASGDSLGYSVAVNGDTAVVGAPGAGASGAAYVFVKPGGGWGTATQTAKLTVAAAAADDSLGTSVAISGDTIVVGADEQISGGAGAAYVFVRPGGGWTGTTTVPDATLTAPGGVAGDAFGAAAAISGTTVAVGAPTAGGLDGAVFVFVRPGGSWSGTPAPTATLTNGIGNSERVGGSVATTGDTIAAGAYSAGSGDGAILVYARPGATWADASAPTATLTASGSDVLGASVAMTSGLIAGGAPGTTISGHPAQGAVYLFAKPGSAWSTTSTPTATLTASDGATIDALGSAVALTDDTVLAGADNATVGANFNQGAVYAWVRSGSGWASATETAKLVASGGGVFDGFGSGVGFDGEAAVIGAGGSTNGNAYVFSTPPGAPTGVTATAGNLQVAVSWTAPTATGGSAITGYTATASPGGTTCTTTGATSCTITGLAAGTTYSISVRATGAGGTGAPSAAASATPTFLSCGKGTYASGGVCLEAPAGSFVAADGSTAPTLCPEGTYQPSRGQASCIKAPAGSAANGPGSTKSTPCPAETGAPFDGFNVCLPCPPDSKTFGRVGQLTCELIGPNPPTNVRVDDVDGLDTALDVSFDAPEPIERVTVDRYTVTASPGGASATGTASPIRVKGLKVGTSYTFKVVATRVPPSANPVDSLPSAPSGAFTAASVPDKPSVGGTPYNRAVVLRITRPDGNGAPVTAYLVTSAQGTRTVTPNATGPNTFVQYVNLVNGKRAYFSVKAVNRRGEGAPKSGFVVPRTVPSQPRSVTATAPKPEVSFTSSTSEKTRVKVVVAFTAPVSDGGMPVTGYTVTVSPGEKVVEGTKSPIEVDGLALGTAYTFAVRAKSVAGAGPAASATATPLAVPNAPMPVTYSVRPGGAHVDITRPSFDGGSPITGYELVVLDLRNSAALKGLDDLDAVDAVRLAPKKAEKDGFDISGLEKGFNYTLLVRARNAAGASFPGFAPMKAVVAPDAPTDVKATVSSNDLGSATISIAFTEPKDTGGEEIDRYRVILTRPGAPDREYVRTGNPIEIWGLDNGVTYGVTLRAVQKLPAGAAEPPLVSPVTGKATVVVPALAPGLPTIGNVVPDDKSAVLSITAPRYDGGSPITGYRVRAYTVKDRVRTKASEAVLTLNGGAITVTGLANGKDYAFDVAAVNAIGTGAVAGPSATVTPSAVPSAPGIWFVNPISTQVGLFWSAPESDGGAPITGYVVTATSSAGSASTSVAGTVNAAILTGLTDDVEYSITVYAINRLGVGKKSNVAKATPAPLRPAAPTGVTVAPGDAKATLTFTKPTFDGGTPITGYVVTVKPGGTTVTGTKSPIEVTGLTNGKAYTFTVAAKNDRGNGTASGEVSTTPAAKASAPRDVKIEQGKGAGVAVISFTAPESDGGSAITGYHVIAKPKCGGCSQEDRLVSGPGTYTFGGFDTGSRVDAAVYAVTSVGNGATGSASGRLLGTPNLAVSDAGHTATYSGGTLSFSFSVNIIVYDGYAAAPHTKVRVGVRNGGSNGATGFSVKFDRATNGSTKSPCDLSNIGTWDCDFPSANGSYTFTVTGSFYARDNNGLNTCEGKSISHCNALLDVLVDPLVDDVQPSDNKYFAQAIWSRGY